MKTTCIVSGPLLVPTEIQLQTKVTSPVTMPLLDLQGRTVGILEREDNWGYGRFFSNDDFWRIRRDQEAHATTFILHLRGYIAHETFPIHRSMDMVGDSLVESYVITHAQISPYLDPAQLCRYPWGAEPTVWDLVEMDPPKATLDQMDPDIPGVYKPRNYRATSPKSETFDDLKLSSLEGDLLGYFLHHNTTDFKGFSPRNPQDIFQVNKAFKSLVAKGFVIEPYYPYSTHEVNSLDPWKIRLLGTRYRERFHV